MQPPWFPVSLQSAPSKKRFHHLDGDPFKVEDITVTYTRLYHPQGVTGYRLERDGVVLVVATDVEHGDSDSDRAVRELAANADVLISRRPVPPAGASRQQARLGTQHLAGRHRPGPRRRRGCLILTSHDPGRPTTKSTPSWLRPGSTSPTPKRPPKA